MIPEVRWLSRFCLLTAKQRSSLILLSQFGHIHTATVVSHSSTLPVVDGLAYSGSGQSHWAISEWNHCTQPPIHFIMHIPVVITYDKSVWHCGWPSPACYWYTPLPTYTGRSTASCPLIITDRRTTRKCVPRKITLFVSGTAFRPFKN